MINKKNWWYCLLLFICISCREPYDPPLNSTTDSYLVVEGTLNVGPAPTTIALSKTLPLDRSSSVKPVNGAVVTVEGKDLSIRTLLVTGPGLYSSANLNLTLNSEYRLRIKTSDGKEYLSSYVVARRTPEIDEIGWEQDEKGVNINVSTHDASKSTIYYKWDYIETWEIRSQYYATVKYVGSGVIVDRVGTDFVYNCWKNNSSKTILIGSSARLVDDVIFKAPITSVSQGDEKMGIRYSVLMRQYALDKSGYEFYEMMKKTSESLGTVFDAQPTEVKGNIKCISNPGELVIGYVSASTISEKRIFITNLQLNNWRFSLPCESYDVPNNKDSLKAYFDGGAWQPYDPVLDITGMRITGYSSSYSTCVDCTTRGGSTTKPSFW